MSDRSGSEPGGRSSPGDTTFRTVWKVPHFVGLWVAFVTVFGPLSVVVNTALVGESLSWARGVIHALPLVAVGITYARYPRTSAIKLWIVGVVSWALFNAVTSATGTSNPPTSGSLLIALRLFLLWAGSLALSAGVLWNWWRGEDAEQEGDGRSTA